jgi:hypothetical protein
MITRFIKSIALFLIMYLSLIYLGFSSDTSVVVSLIPLVLGFIGILVGPAFSVAGVVFIFAAMSALLPPEKRDVLSYFSKIIDVLTSSNVNKSTFDASTNAVKNTNKPATPDIVKKP